MQRWLRQSSTRVSPSNVDGINVFAHLWLMFAWYLRGIKSCSLFSQIFLKLYISFLVSHVVVLQSCHQLNCLLLLLLL